MKTQNKEIKIFVVLSNSLDTTFCKLKFPASNIYIVFRLLGTTNMHETIRITECAIPWNIAIAIAMASACDRHS